MKNIDILQAQWEHERDQGGFSMIADLPFRAWLHRKIELAAGFGVVINNSGLDWFNSCSDDELEATCAAYLKASVRSDLHVQFALDDESSKETH